MRSFWMSEDPEAYRGPEDLDEPDESLAEFLEWARSYDAEMTDLATWENEGGRVE